MIAIFSQGLGHAPGPSDRCVGARIMMFEKVHFLTNATLPSERLATGLFAAMLSVCTVGRVALRERLLPQYEHTYNKIGCSCQHRPTRGFPILRIQLHA